MKDQVQETSAWIRKLREEVGRVIVGQEALVERLLVGILNREVSVQFVVAVETEVA